LGAFSDLTIIIPTLNESGNVRKLIPLLLRRYNGIKIIVADDGSDDGTDEAVRKAAKNNKEKIKFLDRKNRRVHGITASVIDAASIASTKKLLVMDADMQHPYEKAGAISRALDEHDLVIGVRGSVSDWGIYRRIVSKGVSSFSYAVFKLRGKPTCNDMMSGFFGIRTATLRGLINRNRNGFVLEGYKVLLDILRMIGSDARISEVRYDTFHGRKQGESKLRAIQFINVLRSTLR
jgi:dolichol-phosphate mannosyltransferase